MIIFDTLKRGGQGITDGEKVLKLLALMNISNISIGTRMELVRQGLTFQATVTSLSTLIATLFPSINVKGHNQ